MFLPAFLKQPMPGYILQKTRNKEESINAHKRRN